MQILSTFNIKWQKWINLLWLDIIIIITIIIIYHVIERFAQMFTNFNEKKLILRFEPLPREMTFITY